MQPWHFIVVLFFIVVVVMVVVLIVKAASKPKPQQAQIQASVEHAYGLAPGWYPDQSDPKLMRYFDGRTWTSGTAPRNE